MKEDQLKIILKKKLYGKLEELKKATKKVDINRFKKLNRVYTKLHEQIFGSSTPKGTEGFDWDNARNQLTYVLSSLTSITHRPEKEEFYRLQASKWFNEAEEQINALKKYLK